jgi:hypothetical protein
MMRNFIKVFITILLNVRTLSVVEVFCHLDYCSKFFEKSSKFFEKSSKFFEKSSTTYYLKLLNFGITQDYERFKRRIPPNPPYQRLLRRRGDIRGIPLQFH